MPSDAKPNILILFCDQMQHDRMGFVDGEAHTPNLDALAAEGVHFTHAITAHGQCVPARATFHTGQYPHECGIVINYGKSFYNHRNQITRKHRTFAHELSDAGYRTVYFGKSHLGHDHDVLKTAGWGESLNGEHIEVTDEDTERLGIDYVPYGLRSDHVAAERAVEFLRADEPDGGPLCFMFSTNLPHPPFHMAPQYESRFPLAELRLPDTYASETFEGKPPFQREHATDGRHGAGTEDEVRLMTAQYCSMIADMDGQFGRVIAEFKRLGLWDNTYVIFTGDHADMMGAHGLRVKGTLPYDELYRIPLIMKFPAGVEPGRAVVDDLVSSASFAGTILKAAGLDVPGSFTGGEIHGTPFASERPEDEAVYFEHYGAYWGLHPFYGVRTRDAKYVRYFGPDDTDEMYDLAADPHETRNIAGDPAHAGLKERLSTMADENWRATGGRDFEYYESDHFRENRHNEA